MPTSFEDKGMLEWFQSNMSVIIYFRWIPYFVAQDLDSYIAYLRDTVKLPAMDVQLNGGAQFRRRKHNRVWVALFTF